MAGFLLGLRLSVLLKNAAEGLLKVRSRNKNTLLLLLRILYMLLVQEKRADYLLLLEFFLKVAWIQGLIRFVEGLEYLQGPQQFFLRILAAFLHYSLPSSIRYLGFHCERLSPLFRLSFQFH